MVHTVGLMLKSRLESKKSRTVERAAFQYQVLVDQYNEVDPESQVTIRMLYMHQLALPPRWEMMVRTAILPRATIVTGGASLGVRRILCGVLFHVAAGARPPVPQHWLVEECTRPLRAAAHVGRSHRVLPRHGPRPQGGHRSVLANHSTPAIGTHCNDTKVLVARALGWQAEEVLREQLAIKPTPKLLCLLGDITNEPAHYEEAWELSKHRYTRAQRSLGVYYMRQNRVCARPADESAGPFSSTDADAMRLSPTPGDGSRRTPFRVLCARWPSTRCTHARGSRSAART